MGGTQRLAAVAAVAHARRLYNATQEDARAYEPRDFNVNIFFASATLCGAVLAVCVACWRRADGSKREADAALPEVYSVSADLHNAYQSESLGACAATGPPPAYDAVVYEAGQQLKPTDDGLQDVVTEPCPRCQAPAARPDSGLPSYEAAVMLRDTKL